jgi:hypothetical protein
MRKLFVIWSLIASLSLSAIPFARSEPIPETWHRLDSCICQELTCVCDKKVLAEVYDWMVNTAVDAQKCEARIGLLEETCDLHAIQAKHECDEQLDKWFRKWYITIPVGAVIGGVTGLVIGVKF